MNQIVRIAGSLALLAAEGCQPSPGPTEPDVAAIATVVRAAYGEPVGMPTLFLGAVDEADTTVSEARSLVASELHAKVLSLSDRVFDDALPPFTPVDPDSDEPGVTVALGRFAVEQDGRLRVTASFVRRGGTEQGCTEFLLARAAEAWDVVEQRDASPDCPLSEEVLASYDSVVERIRAGDCLGLGARIGTCGPWFVVIVMRIDSSRTWYFDPDTRLLVAEFVFDPMSDIETWTFGYVDCADEDFKQAEFLVCGSPPER